MTRDRCGAPEWRSGVNYLRPWGLRAATSRSHTWPVATMGRSYVLFAGATLAPSTSLMWSRARWLRFGVIEAVASAGTHRR